MGAVPRGAGAIGAAINGTIITAGVRPGGLGFNIHPADLGQAGAAPE